MPTRRDVMRRVVLTGGSLAGVAAAAEASAPDPEDAENPMAQERQVQRDSGTSGFGLVAVAAAAGVGGLVGGAVVSALQGRSDDGSHDSPQGRRPTAGGRNERQASRSPEREPGRTGDAGSVVVCPACGAENGAGTNYCRECGEPV